MRSIRSLKRALWTGVLGLGVVSMSVMPALADDDRGSRGSRGDRGRSFHDDRGDLRSFGGGYDRGCDRGYDRDARWRDSDGFSFSIRVGSDCGTRGSVRYERREHFPRYDDCREVRVYRPVRPVHPVYVEPCEVRVIRPVRPVYVEPCEYRQVGRWERRWVPAEYRYVYDGRGYNRVCVREGYYSKVYIEGRF